MKLKIIPFILLGVLFFASCKQKGEVGKENKIVMAMDSVYKKDKNVTIVGPKDTIRLMESMKKFEDNPNITGADIDAGKNIPSAEIQYVHPGDTLKLGEPDGKKR